MAAERDVETRFSSLARGGEPNVPGSKVDWTRRSDDMDDRFDDMDQAVGVSGGGAPELENALGSMSANSTRF